MDDLNWGFEKMISNILICVFVTLSHENVKFLCYAVLVLREYLKFWY